MFLKRFNHFGIKNLFNVRKNIIFNLSNQSLKVIFKSLWLFDKSVRIYSLYYTLTPKKIIFIFLSRREWSLRVHSQLRFIRRELLRELFTE